ncbi:hypothetical protein H7Q97_08315 [Ochrobactrum sp. CM-21-5]|nr:hypothetical protein [Ochrobactrum sp. CM-21-5]MBC2885410.1 hypothetical protein [Ochrobactrum sp. CM-21-5]
MNIINNSKDKDIVSIEALTKGLSVTLTRPECTDSGGSQSVGGGGPGVGH